MPLFSTTAAEAKDIFSISRLRNIDILRSKDPY